MHNCTLENPLLSSDMSFFLEISAGILVLGFFSQGEVREALFGFDKKKKKQEKKEKARDDINAGGTVGHPAAAARTGALDAEMGMQELQRMASNPGAMAETMDMLQDPEVQAEVENMMRDPQFRDTEFRSLLEL